MELLTFHRTKEKLQRMESSSSPIIISRKILYLSRETELIPDSRFYKYKNENFCDEGVKSLIVRSQIQANRDIRTVLGRG